jgi:hypothetical protein
LLAELGVRLPLRLCDEETGSVLDADDMEVFVVDANRDLSDESASAIAALLVEAVNARTTATHDLASTQLVMALKPFAAVADEWDRWQAMGSTSAPRMIQLRYGRTSIFLLEYQAARTAVLAASMEVRYRPNDAA